MRILHISNTFSPYKGGIVSSLKATIEALNEVGHHSSLVTLDFAHPSQQAARVDLHLIRVLFRFYYKGNQLAIPISTQSQLSVFIKKLKPDILHVHHPFLLGPIAVKQAKKHMLPIIFTYHTRYQDYYHYIPLPATIVKPICASLVANFCARVDGIIVPSYELKQELIQQQLPNTYLEVIPSSLLSIFDLPYQEKIKHSERIELLSVNRFVPEKNIQFLLRAVARLPHNTYHLVLVGYGWYQKTLEKYAYQTLKLSAHNVVFKTIENKQELIKAYTHADFFLFSSITETQGLVLAEAMACSTPVIALNGPGQREIVADGINGFLVNSEREMADILQRDWFLLRDVYQSLCMQAWNTAQHYQTHYIRKTLIHFYRYIIKKRS